MASCNLFSTTFSAPLCCCPQPTSLKVMCRERSDLGRVSHKAVAVTAPNLPAQCSPNLNRGFFSVSRSCHFFLTAKRFDEIVYCSLDVSSCTHMVITGYWVGPDVDDGWGFVEAFVNRMT